ncbi:MAG: metallophosphoesterase [Candidatus Omnitrophota bacterium]
MRVGVASDSHDHITKIKEMVQIIKKERVDFLLHGGDFIAPFALNPLDDLICDWLGVFGNNDGERTGLEKKSGGKIKTGPYFLELSSKRIALMHEFKPSDADVLIYGHTHNPSIRKDGQLIINPGEVCGWLTGKSSLAILDLSSLEAEIIYF